jgi:hypothetical protein
MRFKISILLTLISFSISSQPLKREILLKNKVREIKEFTSENKEIKSLLTHYFINDSGLVYKEINFRVEDDKLDTTTITDYIYDSLNREISDRMTYKGKVFLSEFFYPDSNTVMKKYSNDEGVLSEEILRSDKKGKREIVKMYHNGQHKWTGITTKKDNIINWTEHRKHPRQVSKMTSYLDAQNNRVKTNGTSRGNNPYLTKKYTRTMTYDNYGELIKSCDIHYHNHNTTPLCTYYEYIKY